MSLLTIILLAAFVFFYVWLVRDNKKHKWKTVYETTGNRGSEADSRFDYLKNKGLHPRINHAKANTANVADIQNTQMSKQLAIQVQIQKKEEEQAVHYLAKYTQQKSENL